MNKAKLGNMFFEGKVWSYLSCTPFRIALDKFPATCKKQAIVDLSPNLMPPYEEEVEITTIISVDGVLLVSLSLDEVDVLCHAAETSLDKDKISIYIDEKASATIKGTTIEIPAVAILIK
jgi:hypothetical protein